MRSMTEASTQNADALDAQAPPRAVRHRLPAERASVTHKFGLGGHEGYITVGLYPNGSPGEIFIRMAKEGSTVSGLMDSFATAISISLQHGVPLRVLCEKFAHTRFEPSGWTGNPEIGYAKSIMDYIFRWIQMRFLSGTQLDLFAGLTPHASVPVEGTVTAPGNTVSLAEAAISSEPGESRDIRISSEVPQQAGSNDAADSVTESASEAPVVRSHFPSVPSALAAFAAADEASPQAILQREQREARTQQQSISDQDIFDNGARGGQYGSLYDRARGLQEGARSQFEDRTPPQHGIAPDLTARSGMSNQEQRITDNVVDRGIYHPSDAMKGMYEMGDSPSCATCGAIMTRSGSCYRCMSCGSTSGCS
jgi:ribonucleoside-diphosphate reductase alpha chain